MRFFLNKDLFFIFVTFYPIFHVIFSLYSSLTRPFKSSMMRMFVSHQLRRFLLMKKMMFKATVAAVSLGIVSLSYASIFSSGPTLKTDTDKVSYSIGYDIGSNFKSQNINIESDQFAAGFNDGLNGKTPAMTQDDMQATLMAFQKQMMQQAMQKQQQLAQTNLAASQAYLQKISTQTGVTQLAPGLYYQVVTAGTGKVPKASDVVTVNYEGTLPDGTVFDSSYKRGQPATFQVNQVIPGWTKVLQKMPAGSTWMVYIAPDLAYGTYAPPQIGPNQALTFKIELISINKPGSVKAKPASSTSTSN